MGDQIMQFISGELFELTNIYDIKVDLEIETGNEEVHKTLMRKSTFRIGDVGEEVYVYLIDGKFIRVNNVRND
jgi:hypothetical protein